MPCVILDLIILRIHVIEECRRLGHDAVYTLQKVVCIVFIVIAVRTSDAKLELPDGV
jgi:hypothetical protein